MAGIVQDALVLVMVLQFVVMAYAVQTKIIIHVQKIVTLLVSVTLDLLLTV